MKHTVVAIGDEYVVIACRPLKCYRLKNRNKVRNVW